MTLLGCADLVDDSPTDSEHLAYLQGRAHASVYLTRWSIYTPPKGPVKIKPGLCPSEPIGCGGTGKKSDGGSSVSTCSICGGDGRVSKEEAKQANSETNTTTGDASESNAAPDSSPLVNGRVVSSPERTGGDPPLTSNTESEESLTTNETTNQIKGNHSINDDPSNLTLESLNPDSDEKPKTRPSESTDSSPNVSEDSKDSATQDLPSELRVGGEEDDGVITPDSSSPASNLEDCCDIAVGLSERMSMTESKMDQLVEVVKDFAETEIKEEKGKAVGDTILNGKPSKTNLRFLTGGEDCQQCLKVLKHIEDNKEDLGTILRRDFNLIVLEANKDEAVPAFWVTEDDVKFGYTNPKDFILWLTSQRELDLERKGEENAQK